MDKLPKDEKVTERIIETRPQNTNILGIWWDTTSNILHFKANEERILYELHVGRVTLTKRIALRIVMMVLNKKFGEPK